MKRGLPLSLLRVVALSGFSIGACVWALVRVYTHPRPSMWVAVPAEPPAADLDAGEIPAPELTTTP